MARNQLKYKDENSEGKKRPAGKKKNGPGWIDKVKSTIAKVIEFVENEKTHRAFGLALLLFSIYLLLAFSSFIFTGRIDYNLIQNSSLTDFLFDPNIEAENWLGNLGAVVSHIFIYNWFGMPSMVFPFLFFIVGMRILFKTRLLHMGKAFRYSTFVLIWGSVGLGFIFYHHTFKILFGQFGYFINTWLFRVIGRIGTGFLLTFVLGLFLVYTFNISFDFFRKKEEADEEDSDENEDETVVPVIAESEEQETELEESNEESTLTLQVEEPVAETDALVEAEDNAPETPEEEQSSIEQESQPVELDSNVPVTAEAEPNPDEEVELAIEDKATDETILSEKEVNKKLEEFGEFDPTLELSSYQVPSIDLLNTYGSDEIGVNKEELEANKNRIVSSLENYNIKIQSIKATIGPTVTLYEIVPAAGIRISKIKNLEDDIALSLSALGIRIIAPIPGKGTIGIEVPNKNPETVSMKTVISSNKFQDSKMELPVVIGKTISNESYVFDLAKMPHLLMAGATGQGKSVGLNAILTSLLYKKHPAQLKFVLVDPKKVELTLYSKIERHFLAKLPDTEEAIITDNKKVITTLNSLCVEMDNRYELLKSAFVRNIKEYNEKFIARKLNPENGHKYLPYIVLVVDEFADLIMTAGKEVEQPIARLAQLARAIGIHLIIATQRPSTNIITGSIKANFPARVAFRVTSGIDSRTILDAGGAEQLIGRGDMLLSTGNDLIRIQCAFVDTPEVEKLTEFIGEQRGYPDAFILPEYVDESASQSGDLDASDRDAMFEEAARLVVQHQQGSASLLQRRLKLGYNRAGRIIDQLEAAGIIGPFEGSKARKVLIHDEMALEQFLNGE